MTTAVDTSVLLAIFKREPGHEGWLDLMADHAAAGPLVACEVVWAEVGGFFAEFERLEESLDLLSVRFDAIAPGTAHFAGRAFRAYRDRGGPRTHLIPDFLIGAHGQLQADGLLALDRGFYRRYFRDLKVVAPTG